MNCVRLCYFTIVELMKEQPKEYKEIILNI